MDGDIETKDGTLLSGASAPAYASWRDVPVTMEFLANLFDAYCGADGHNLVVAIAANVAKQKLG